MYEPRLVPNNKKNPQGNNDMVFHTLIELHENCLIQKIARNLTNDVQSEPQLVFLK